MYIVTTSTFIHICNVYQLLVQFCENMTHHVDVSERAIWFDKCASTISQFHLVTLTHKAWWKGGLLPCILRNDDIISDKGGRWRWPLLCFTWFDNLKDWILEYQASTKPQLALVSVFRDVKDGGGCQNLGMEWPFLGAEVVQAGKSGLFWEQRRLFLPILEYLRYSRLHLGRLSCRSAFGGQIYTDQT